MPSVSWPFAIIRAFLLASGGIIDLICLWELYRSWGLSKLRELSINTIITLQEAHKRRDPSGWIFYDGDGQF